MPDLGDMEKDLEKEASSHPQQADDAIKKADQEVDGALGGKDHGLVDKGAAEAEQKLGGGGSAPATGS